MKFVNGLVLEVTQKCNSECKYCFSNSTHLTCNELPIEKLKNIIYQYLTLENKLLYDAYEKKHLKSQLVLTGGEIFLYSKWRELLDYLTTLNYPFDIATNGILLDEEKINYLSNTTVNDFQISLDGVDPIDNILRNPKNTELIKENIIKVSETDLKNRTTIKATVTIHNFNRVEPLIDFCQKHDVRIVFGYMQVLGRATKNIELALDSDQIVKFNKNIIENHPNIVLPLMFSHTPCPLDIDTEPLSFRVASDGRVFPCASFHEDFFCIGNIYDNTLSDIINSDKFKSIQNWVHERKKIMSNNQCRNCYVSNLCQGSCPAASYYEMGDVNIPVDRLCEASKKFNYYMLPKLLNNIKLQERG